MAWDMSTNFVGINPSGKDEESPIFGRYGYTFKPGSLKRLRTEEQVTVRLLDKQNEEAIIALKSGLVDSVEL